MKRTTTTTEHFDAYGKLTERVVVTTEEDEYVPVVQAQVYPYTPTYPQQPFVVTTTSAPPHYVAYSAPRLVPPPDDDGLAGVPAIA